MNLTRGIGNVMKSRASVSLCVLLLVTGVAVNTVAQGNDQRLTTIRAQVAEVDRQIAESESQGEYSSIFRNELVLNQRENPWPAVGIYQKTVRFYYSFGDREVDPYPNRLLKITVTTKRSDRREYAEYVFDLAGNLIFARVANGDADAGADLAANAAGYYFGAGKVIAVQSGSKDPIQCAFTTIDSSRAAMNEGKKLAAIFRNSLE